MVGSVKFKGQCLTTAAAHQGREAIEALARQGLYSGGFLFRPFPRCYRFMGFKMDDIGGRYLIAEARYIEANGTGGYEYVFHNLVEPDEYYRLIKLQEVALQQWAENIPGGETFFSQSRGISTDISSYCSWLRPFPSDGNSMVILQHQDFKASIKLSDEDPGTVNLPGFQMIYDCIIKNRSKNIDSLPPGFDYLDPYLRPLSH